jgi:glycosyltransferase involved in cell wall biosynthesis
VRLSVIIPVYNERRTLATVLASVAAAMPAVAKEIVIVDDGSSDGTREWLRANFPTGARHAAAIDVGAAGDLLFTERAAPAPIAFRAILRDGNGGKGAAVRTGFAAATGDVFVIQDADLEYEPRDWVEMYELIATRGVADVVFGSRFHGRAHRSLAYHHYFANRLISGLFCVLYNQTLTDIEVCYKMMTAPVARSLRLTADDFGIEVEISAEIARRRRLRIYEVGIAYYGRSYADGKKIGWKDGIKALWYLVKFRIRKRPEAM